MLNIKSIISEVKKRAENKVFMGDIKDTRLYEIIGSDNFGHWGDSRYWVFNIDYYKKHMLNCYMDMNDCVWGKWAEDYLLHFARKYRHDNRFIFRFRTQVLFNGITGMRTSEDLNAGRYRQDSIGQKIKWSIRQIMRWLFPFFWF